MTQGGSKTERSFGAETVDFLVIGGGVVGITIAMELRRRHPDCSVTVLEKERAAGMHASGRNSGVLHAGFYYTADSLKARFCREGNAALRAWCAERRIPVNHCGKLVVARDEGDLAGVDELGNRAERNGVELQRITAAEARQIEPRVRTFERALFSPTTSTVDPAVVMRSLTAAAADMGVDVRTRCGYRSRTADGVRTTTGELSAGYIVNSAGLYADRVAWDYGFAQGYRMLPFKGLYLYSAELPDAFKTCIYPVPDLRNPFLGVHLTVAADGHAKIGPTAIPAFWREHYHGMARFRIREMAAVVSVEARLLVRAGFNFRGLALEEVRKYWRPYLVAQARCLADGIRERDYRRWGHPGIRAQLLDTRNRTLVMDFLLQGDKRSMHVLNAVSPAFTCSMPFAAYVCDEIAKATS